MFASTPHGGVLLGVTSCDRELHQFPTTRVRMWRRWNQWVKRSGGIKLIDHLNGSSSIEDVSGTSLGQISFSHQLLIGRQSVICRLLMHDVQQVLDSSHDSFRIRCSVCRCLIHATSILYPIWNRSRHFPLFISWSLIKHKHSYTPGSGEKKGKDCKSMWSGVSDSLEQVDTSSWCQFFDHHEE
jgi:hypothetical protein